MQIEDAVGAACAGRQRYDDAIRPLPPDKAEWWRHRRDFPSRLKRRWSVPVVVHKLRSRLLERPWLQTARLETLCPHRLRIERQHWMISLGVIRCPVEGENEETCLLISTQR